MNQIGLGCEPRTGQVYRESLAALAGLRVGKLFDQTFDEARPMFDAFSGHDPIKTTRTLQQVSELVAEMQTYKSRRW